jgi:hypothetical protein
VTSIRRHEAKERQAFADLHVYMTRLNALRLRRLKEVSSKVAALRPGPQQAPGPSKLISMVRRWLSRAGRCRAGDQAGGASPRGASAQPSPCP